MYISLKDRVVIAEIGIGIASNKYKPQCQLTFAVNDKVLISEKALRGNLYDRCANAV